MGLGKCKKCEKKAVTAIDAGETPLCGKHYVAQADEECLKSSLLNDISCYGKIKEHKDIQLEIKKQRPKLYEQLEGYFEV